MKKEKEILSPNILLTNFCNQNCDYCFAKKEMKEGMVKEMSMDNFLRMMKLLKKNKIDQLRLMGGEPTLHSQFDLILSRAYPLFKQIIIFSNGLVSLKSIKAINQYADKIILNFNLDTQAFENNLKQRKQIIALINEFSLKTKVFLGFTLSNLEKDYLELFKGFKKDIWQKIGIRFGLAKPSPGERPFFAKGDYPKIGNKIIFLVKSFKEMGIKDVFLDCGLKKEMFDWRERHYLTKNSHLRGWNCEGKWSSFDITPDLTIFPCFPYYNKLRKKLDDFKNFNQARDYFKKIKNFCLDNKK